jgi:hypothetical protein
LSSSQLCGAEWKVRVLATAERIVNRHLENPFLSARVRLRRKIVCRTLSEGPWEGADHNSELPRHLKSINAASNAHLGEGVLFSAEQMIDRDQLGEAWSVLESFTPLDPQNPSPRETLVMDWISLAKGKICRFSGDFNLAKKHLLHVMERGSVYGIVSRAVSHYVAVSCELQNMDEATAMALGETRLSENELRRGRRRRVMLTLAEAYLMKCLWAVASDPMCSHPPGGIRDMLQDAANIFTEFGGEDDCGEHGRVFKLNRFRIAVGLAIISRLTDDLTSAANYWTAAAAAARDCGWRPGFPEMVIAYSVSELQLRRGQFEASKSSFQTAERLFRTGRRQTYFIGLGTVWFDLVGSWMEHQGGRRIA